MHITSYLRWAIGPCRLTAPRTIHASSGCPAFGLPPEHPKTSGRHLHVRAPTDQSALSSQPDRAFTLLRVSARQNRSSSTRTTGLTSPAKVPRVSRRRTSLTDSQRNSLDVEVTLLSAKFTKCHTSLLRMAGSLGAVHRAFTRVHSPLSGPSRFADLPLSYFALPYDKVGPRKESPRAYTDYWTSAYQIDSVTNASCPSSHLPIPHRSSAFGLWRWMRDCDISQSALLGRYPCCTLQQGFT